MTTGHTELLNDYVQPYLISEVVSNFIVVNNFKITNKGVLKMTDDNSQNVNPDELNYIKNFYSNLVTRHKTALIEYVGKNHQNNSCGDSNNLNPTTSSTGWYLN